MKKQNYKVFTTQSMNDKHITTTHVTLEHKKTGVLFEGIGIAKVDLSKDNFNQEFGERLSFTRGYRKTLKRALKDLEPRYEYAKAIFIELLNERNELIDKIERTYGNENCQLGLLESFVDPTDKENEEE